jgi:hypothetical protein
VYLQDEGGERNEGIKLVGGQNIQSLPEKHPGCSDQIMVFLAVDQKFEGERDRVIKINQSFETVTSVHQFIRLSCGNVSQINSNLNQLYHEQILIRFICSSVNFLKNIICRFKQSFF